MNEREMYAKIRMITLGLAGICSIGAFVIFKNNPTPYVLGIVIGALLGIISFNMIIKMSSRIMEGNAERVAVSNYMLRIIGIAVIFVLALNKGIDIFALLIGFICSKIAIQVFAQLERKGNYDQSN